MLDEIEGVDNVHGVIRIWEPISYGLPCNPTGSTYTKEELTALAAAAPDAAPAKLGVGGNGKKNEEDFRRCCLGEHFIADPDGVLIDVSER